MTSYGSMASSGRMLMVDSGPLSLGSSLHRASASSTNPGGGHGGLLLDVDSGSVASWDGVLCASVFAAGQLLLWATGRDPLRWACLLQLQLQLWLRQGFHGWAPLARASSLPSNWIVPWPQRPMSP